MLFSFKQFITEWDGTQLDLPMKMHTHYKPSEHHETQMHPEDLVIQSRHREGRRYDEHSHSEYKGDSETFVNDHLRKGFNGRHIELPHADENHGNDIEHNVDQMDHNTNVELKHPLKTYRGFSTSFKIHHLNPGDEFTDHGYTGTSLSKHIAKNFSSKSAIHPDRHAVAVIHSPPGTKGHLLDHPDFPDTGMNEEKEFTLHRGTTFKVHKHEMHTDENGEKYHMIHLHVTDQHAHYTHTREPEHEDEDWDHHHDEDE